MKNVLITLTTVALVGLYGCAATGGQSASGMAKAPAAMSAVDKAIAEAEKELATTKKMGHEWQLIDKATGRNSQPLSKLLEAAKKARDSGDSAEAMRIADRVAETARLGQRQAKEQANAGPHFPK